ncbi:MAG: hypothetical protein ACREER_02280 [Alphaproteobacteria bacterium]
MGDLWRTSTWRRVVAGAVIVLAAAAGSSGQTALRVRGVAQSTAFAGVPATVELSAVHGFRGLQFVGQKSFTVRANDKGQWSVLGVTSGAWMFAAHSPSHLPQAVILPVQLTQRNPNSAAGGQLPWEVGFDLVPRETHPDLIPAAEAAVAGRRGEVAALLARVVEAAEHADVVVAAGEIALDVRDSGLARAIFDRALVLAPSHGRARLGLASAAMIDGAWDRASKELWTAREQGISPRIVRAVGAAITDLQRIATTQDGHRCPGGPGC